MAQIRLVRDELRELELDIEFLRKVVVEAGGTIEISKPSPGRKGGFLSYGSVSRPTTTTRIVKVDPQTGEILE